MLRRILIPIRSAVVLVLMVLRCILCGRVLHGDGEVELGGGVWGVVYSTYLLHSLQLNYSLRINATCAFH